MVIRLAAFRGRDAHFLAPPAEIRASPIRALGCYLGCLTANRTFGQGCRTRASEKLVNQLRFVLAAVGAPRWSDAEDAWRLLMVRKPPPAEAGSASTRPRTGRFQSQNKRQFETEADPVAN